VCVSRGAPRPPKRLGSGVREARSRGLRGPDRSLARSYRCEGALRPPLGGERDRRLSSRRSWCGGERDRSRSASTLEGCLSVLVVGANVPYLGFWPRGSSRRPLRSSLRLLRSMFLVCVVVMSRLEAHANQKFEVQLLQMEHEVTPGTSCELQPTLPSHVNVNIYTTNSKIEYGVDRSSWIRPEFTYIKTTRQKTNTCQHGNNPPHPLDPPVVGRGLQPPITCSQEIGKRTTHSDLGQSDQTSITGWNELPRSARNR